MLTALHQLAQAGVTDLRRLRVITALTASPGLKTLGELIPELTIHTACIDEGLDDADRIVPGIGDPVGRMLIRSASDS